MSDQSSRVFDEVDRARAREYALLATLLRRSPDAELLSNLADLAGDTSPIGLAHAALASSARRATEQSVSQEYFALFTGLGGAALLPYSSHYLAGTLYGRPLVRLRQALQALGVEKSPERAEPEDHVAFLCEVMAGLAGGGIPAPEGADRSFFQQHLSPWIRRLFVDIEKAEAADFYASVAALGRTFVEIEAKALELSA